MSDESKLSDFIDHEAYGVVSQEAFDALQARLDAAEAENMKLVIAKGRAIDRADAAEAVVEAARDLEGLVDSVGSEYWEPVEKALAAYDELARSGTEKPLPGARVEGGSIEGIAE